MTGPEKLGRTMQTRFMPLVEQYHVKLGEIQRLARENAAGIKLEISTLENMRTPTQLHASWYREAEHNWGIKTGVDYDANLPPSWVLVTGAVFKRQTNWKGRVILGQMKERQNELEGIFLKIMELNRRLTERGGRIVRLKRYAARRGQKKDLADLKATDLADYKQRKEVVSRLLADGLNHPKFSRSLVECLERSYSHGGD